MTASSPAALGRQLAAHLDIYSGVLPNAASLARDLQSEQVTEYTIVHAEEHLEHIADALDELAKKVRSLKPYTRTGAARLAADRARVQIGRELTPDEAAALH